MSYDPLADKLASYCLTDKDETFMIRTARGLYRLKVPLRSGATEARFVDDQVTEPVTKRRGGQDYWPDM